MSEDREPPTATVSGGNHGAIRDAARRAGVALPPTGPHPGADFEALPDDAVRPTEVTIRPRYADDVTTAWVSARLGDTVSLADRR